MESAHLHHHQHEFQDHHHHLPPIFASPPLPNDYNNIIISSRPSFSSSSPSICYGVSTTNWTQSNNILSPLASHPSSRNHQPHLICSPDDDDNGGVDDMTSPPGLAFHHWANNSIKPPELSTVEGGEATAPPAAAAAQRFYCSRNGDGGGRLITSQIYPTINVPRSTSLMNTNNDNNLQALDLFNSEDHSQEFGFQNFGMDHHHHHHHQLQPSNQQRPLFCSNSFPDIGGALSSNNNNNHGKYPTKNNVQVKRQNGVEPMPPHAPLTKKSRLDSRASSSPPFKVRKEKLGDRIAALQQLVAPFGKTDTASVLMEAIGYINFLQNQVQTLSFPYMKPSRNHTGNRAIVGGPQQQQEDNNESEERSKISTSLRSRGLCLVPLSCLSYIIPDTGGGGGGSGFWPPHNFGGS